MIYARKLFERFTFEAKMPHLLPVATASVITLAGVGLALAALGQTGSGVGANRPYTAP
jgi:hypothetical protein